jgi:enoyl-CoA hydratase/carnithine racemase
MEYHHIKVEVKDAVQAITLNRPDVLNSFHLAMAREVQDALGVAAADDAIRAVLITGEGRGFCAGQDLATIQFVGLGSASRRRRDGAVAIQPDHSRDPSAGEAGGVRRERCRGRRGGKHRVRL